MKAKITRTSNWAYGKVNPCDDNEIVTHYKTGEYEDDIWVKEFKSIEELIAFRNRCGEDLIISTWHDKEEGEKYGYDFDIEIYDTYRE